MTDLDHFTDSDLHTMFERSKHDRAIFVGSEIRQLIGDIWSARGQFPTGLHSETVNLVRRFAVALAKKLRAAQDKYDVSDNWRRDDWEDECRADLYEHLAKGDPLDVAAYCAFMWQRKWVTFPSPSRPEVFVQPMKLADGRTDFYVTIKLGDREVTPHVFREEYKAAYHVALYDWLLNGSGEEPELVKFGPKDWPAQVTRGSQPAYATRTITTENQIKHMVERFLMWKLPEHFNPDCGISFDQSYRSDHGPVGTNLFDFVQATAMVRHMIEGLNLPSPREPGFIKPDTDQQVFFYEQDFYVLSNFSAFRLRWKNHSFDTSEAAYHWEKFVGNDPLRIAIRLSDSAHEAFKIAEEHKHLRRPDWDDVKVDIMRDILRAKAAQHEYVRRKLLATGDRELIEDSWRDDFWGWGPHRNGQQERCLLP